MECHWFIVGLVGFKTGYYCCCCCCCSYCCCLFGIYYSMIVLLSAQIDWFFDFPMETDLEKNIESPISHFQENNWLVLLWNLKDAPSIFEFKEDLFCYASHSLSLSLPFWKELTANRINNPPLFSSELSKFLILKSILISHNPKQIS